MATHTTKSRTAGRHPTEKRTAGKRAPDSKRPASEETKPRGNDEASARISHGGSPPRVKPGIDERDSSSVNESSERNPTRGTRWERADDETMFTRADEPGGADAPLADSDEAPEGSER